MTQFPTFHHSNCSEQRNKHSPPTATLPLPPVVLLPPVVPLPLLLFPVAHSLLAIHFFSKIPISWALTRSIMTQLSTFHHSNCSEQQNKHSPRTATPPLPLLLFPVAHSLLAIHFFSKNSNLMGSNSLNNDSIINFPPLKLLGTTK
jgi:hypothetical protein